METLGGIPVILNTNIGSDKVILMADPMTTLRSVVVVMHPFMQVRMEHNALDALDIIMGKLLARAHSRLDAAGIAIATQR